MMVFSMTSMVWAAGEISDDRRNNQVEFIHERIRAILAIHEENKEDFGYENIDFGLIEIGAAIPTYEYIDGVFQEMNFRVYPLFSDKRFFSTALVDVSEKEPVISVSATLANRINSQVIGGESIALIYDKEGLHIYTGGEITLLNTSGRIAEGRSSIYQSYSEIRNISSIETREAIPVYDIGYQSMSAEMARNSASWVGLNVRFVTQHPYDQICWAASIAAIGNYVFNASHTAVNVARHRFPAPQNFNRALTIGDARALLLSYWGLAFQADTANFNYNQVIRNLNGGFPLYASFRFSGGGHAVVITGVSAMSGLLGIMDPWTGNVIASLSGGVYRYICEDQGDIMTFSRYLPRFN